MAIKRDAMYTLGEYLLQEALPDEIRDKTQGKALTKKELQTHMSAYAKENPEGFVKAVGRLKETGDTVSTLEGLTVGLDDIAPDYSARNPIMRKALLEVRKVRSPTARRKIIAKAEKEILEQTKSHPGSLTVMAKSGGRGNMAQLMKTVSSPVAVNGNDGQMAPWLITHSYSEGLSPAESWIAGAESRRNVIQSTGSVVEPGAAAKVIINNMSDLVVTELDCRTRRGIRLPVEDQIIDRVLARPAGEFQADTIVTPEVAQALRKGGTPFIWVRSPTTCASRSGVCQRCVGLDEWGKLHPVGTNVGVRSAQALSEPLTQFTLNAKHAVRTVGSNDSAKELRGLHGFRMITEMPESFTARAILSRTDGTVAEVKKAPQGGHFITVGDERHYAVPGNTPIVRVGAKLEAGDALTDGTAMPDDLVRYKGIGEGRRYMADQLVQLYRRQGVDLDRRHAELLAKNAINYVQIDADPTKRFIPGEIVAYGEVERALARKTKDVPLKEAVNLTLGGPVLHYSIGTRLTPSVVRVLKDEGVTEVPIATSGPSFSPVVKSLIQNPLLSDDWMSRLSHRYLKKTLVDGAGFGFTTDISGTNPVPAYAMGVPFGSGADGSYMNMWAGAAEPGLGVPKPTVASASAFQSFAAINDVKLGQEKQAAGWPRQVGRILTPSAKKPAAPVVAQGIGSKLKKVLIGNGQRLEDLPDNKVVSSWGAGDFEAFEADKLQKWLPKNLQKQVNFFDGPGQTLTDEGASRYRAIDSLLDSIGTRNLDKKPFAPEELAELSRVGVSLSPQDFEHIQRMRGGVLPQTLRGIRQVAFGDAPFRTLKQRYQMGGIFGPRGVIAGDLAIDPALTRVIREAKSQGWSKDRAKRLALYGGMDLANKGLSYGMPAYMAYQLATKGAPPHETKGEALGGVVGNTLGWAAAAPMGLLGSFPLGIGSEVAGRRIGRKLDPPDETAKPLAPPPRQHVGPPPQRRLPLDPATLQFAQEAFWSGHPTAQLLNLGYQGAETAAERARRLYAERMATGAAGLSPTAQHLYRSNYITPGQTGLAPQDPARYG